MVQDGAVRKTVRLTRSDLRGGSVTWTRESGDVRVDLVVNSNGRRRTGMAEFFGPPAIPGDEASISSLKADNDALRAQLASSTARARSAENLVRILEQRLLTPENSAAAPAH